MVDLGKAALPISIFGYRIAVAYVVFGLIAIIGGSTANACMEAEIEDFPSVWLRYQWK